MGKIVQGSAGQDGIVGSTGNDFLFGGDGNDIIYSSIGNDLLAGQGGNDTLIGGGGLNTYIGGTGKDVIINSGTGWNRCLYVINPGDTGNTTETADEIYNFHQFDQILVNKYVATGSHLAQENTRINSIEDAVRAAKGHHVAESLAGRGHQSACMYQNPVQKMSYLVMDMNGDGSFESGVILHDFYITDSHDVNKSLHDFMDDWLVYKA